MRCEPRTSQVPGEVVVAYKRLDGRVCDSAAPAQTQVLQARQSSSLIVKPGDGVHPGVRNALAPAAEGMSERGQSAIAERHGPKEGDDWTESCPQRSTDPGSRGLREHMDMEKSSSFGGYECEAPDVGVATTILENAKLNTGYMGKI